MAIENNINPDQSSPVVSPPNVRSDSVDIEGFKLEATKKATGSTKKADREKARRELWTFDKQKPEDNQKPSKKVPLDPEEEQRFKERCLSSSTVKAATAFYKLGMTGAGAGLFALYKIDTKFFPPEVCSDESAEAYIRDMIEIAIEEMGAEPTYRALFWPRVLGHPCVTLYRLVKDGQSKMIEQAIEQEIKSRG